MNEITKKGNKKTKGGFVGVFLFYFLVAFEFAYMAGPFAIYFYSVYSPVLNFFNKTPVLSWLIKFFLPHVVRTTASPFINGIQIVGIVLSLVGFLVFVIGACQIYYSKLAKKGAVLGGLYSFIRHPQYTSFMVCGFGLLLLWPRYIVIIFYVTLVFGYNLLARVEERECEEKFGESYIEYEKKTGRFFPSFGKEKEVNHGKWNIGKGICLYVVVMALFLAAAFGLNQLTIDSLYAQFEEQSATVALCELDTQTIHQVVTIAKESEEVQKYLNSFPENSPELNYILPTEWFAAEIPMNGIEYRAGHKSTQDYNRNTYKIIFLKPQLSNSDISKGSDILWRVQAIQPVVEVWVDLAQNQVTDIKEMPEQVKYEGIPEAIY